MKTVWKKLLLPAALALVVISNTAMAAAAAPTEQRQQDEAAGIEHKQSVSVPGKHGRRHWKHKDRVMFIGNGIHQQMYISLLVEKYAPQSQKEWASVLEESARLHSELKTIHSNLARKDDKTLWKDKTFRKDMMKHRERHIEAYKQFNEAIISRDAFKIKTALDGMLPVYSEQNKLLKELLAKVQRQASANWPAIGGLEHNI